MSHGKEQRKTLSSLIKAGKQTKLEMSLPIAAQVFSISQENLRALEKNNLFLIMAVNSETLTFHLVEVKDPKNTREILYNPGDFLKNIYLRIYGSTQSRNWEEASSALEKLVVNFYQPLKDILPSTTFQGLEDLTPITDAETSLHVLSIIYHYLDQNHEATTIEINQQGFSLENLLNSIVTEHSSPNWL